MSSRIVQNSAEDYQHIGTFEKKTKNVLELSKLIVVGEIIERPRLGLMLMLRQVKAKTKSEAKPAATT